MNKQAQLSSYSNNLNAKKTTKLLVKMILIATSVFSYNLHAQQFSAQPGGHCFTLDIPDYLTKTYQINNNASLQYMNAQKESYVIVIVDDKEHLAELGLKYIDAEDFLENFIDDYQADADNRQVGEISNFEYNSFGHSQVEMSWASEGNEIYMLVTAVETPGHFYKILTWTLMQYKDTLEEDYRRISQSISE